jgi:hypothetical protein
LYEQEISAIATDTRGIGMEVRPNEIDVFQPLHQVALVQMGLAIGEIFDLDTLSADCAADGRYEFMLAASPLPITGAVGSPVAAVVASRKFVAEPRVSARTPGDGARMHRRRTTTSPCRADVWVISRGSVPGAQIRVTKGTDQETF